MFRIILSNLETYQTLLKIFAINFKFSIDLNVFLANPLHLHINLYCYYFLMVFSFFFLLNPSTFFVVVSLILFIFFLFSKMFLVFVSRKHIFLVCLIFKIVVYHECLFFINKRIFVDLKFPCINEIRRLFNTSYFMFNRICWKKKLEKIFL